MHPLLDPAQVLPWNYGTGALMRNLARCGLLA